MREIKFRAWHEGGMVYWDMFRNDDTYLLDAELTIQEDEDYIMQYTGLKDRNGKEIYEGDIVKFPQWEDYDKGLMGEGIGTVEWYSSDAAFEIIHDNDSDLLDNAPNMEVIGNIYENPELLKM